jgi:putative tricarboxylic transport membrane protein
MTASVPESKGPAPEDPVLEDPAVEEGGAPIVSPVHDIAAGFVLAALSLFALLWLIPTQTKSAAGAYDVSPGFFPRVAAGAVLILSIFLIGHRIARFRALRRLPSSSDGGAVLTEIAVWTVACAAIWIGLWQVGFLVVAPLIIAIAMVAAGVRRWWLIVVIAAAVTAATYYGADTLFEAALP